METQTSVRKSFYYIQNFILYLGIFIFKDHEDPMRNYIEEKKKKEKKERYMYIMKLELLLCNYAIL